MSNAAEKSNENGDGYAGPRSTNEYNRLRVQHEFIKFAMDGKLLYAPIDTKSSGLRVLDSATGDGYWLVDLAAQLQAPTELVGADIAPQHFIPSEELPQNTVLFKHNIFDQWPEQYQAHFDLAHQRFVLMVCNDDTSVKAIQNLFATVKPGGWIQLHDGDMDTIEEGEGHRAMEKFRDVVRKGWQTMGFNLSPGPKLVGWLRESGAVDIEEKVLTIKCGRASEDYAQGERVLSMLTASLDNMIGLTQKIPAFPYSGGDMMQLKQDLTKELRETGNSYRTHVVWGRKPL